MLGATSARGLGDLRTAISHRIRATPPQKGNTHLDLYILYKERQRLETELARLDHRRRRIDERIAEIRGGTQALEAAAHRAAARSEAQGAVPATAGVADDSQPDSAAADPDPAAAGRWKQMTVGY